jgi:hypothetical protein
MNNLIELFLDANPEKKREEFETKELEEKNKIT